MGMKHSLLLRRGGDEVKTFSPLALLSDVEESLVSDTERKQSRKPRGRLFDKSHERKSIRTGNFSPRESGAHAVNVKQLVFTRIRTPYLLT